MSIERPIFYEGQILSAADLSSSLAYGRGQTARHERYCHLWGIANGLELKAKEKKVGTTTYQEITLSAGVAIDITGKEIVITEDELLSETDFDQSNVAISDLKAWYPVFLVGIDSNAVQTQSANGACGIGASTRINESHLVQFGRPGDELDWENQTSPKVTDSPGNTVSRLLLGFVQWDGSNPSLAPGRFTKLDVSHGRRYAGVQADVVAARSGNLELRNHTDIQAGKPALIMDEDKDDGARLRFGLLTADGALTALFTISAKGGVKTEGAIQSPIKPSSVQIDSGIISDGLIVPLPPGITDGQVTSGQVTLHISISPFFSNDIPSPTGVGQDWIAAPLECTVDSGTRRISSLYRWYQLSAPGTFFDRPGVCNYTVLASVPPTREA